MRRPFRLGLICLISTISATALYYFFKKRYAKSRILQELSSPFLIQTYDHKYIGYTEDNQKQWKGSFTFIQAADTQFGLIDRYVWRKPVVKWDKEIHLLRLVVQDINKLTPRPKFFIICGDLVDAFPTETDRRKAQVTDLKLVLAELDTEIKLVCICGNHDVGDIPTKEAIVSYKKDFGEDYFSWWYGGVKFLALNSQYFFNSSLVPELKDEQDAWLEKELKIGENKWKHLMIFQHIPWFLHDPNEATHAYFNIELKERLRWLAKFKSAGVSKIFCGHYHQNAGGYYDNLEVITTSAIGAQLGADKHGYRLVEVSENEVKHKYISVTDTVN